MCFTVPLKVIKVAGDTIVLENGEHIPRDTSLSVKKGQYVRISGSLIIDTLSQSEGDSIRQLIAELNTNYEQ